MKTFSKIFLLFLFIFTLSCNKNQNENKIEDPNKWFNNDFHLQMLFLPSFKAACFVEIYNRNGTRILSMSPMREGYFDYEHFIKFPKSQCILSEIEFEDFCTKIKNIDLKTIKSSDACFVDGIGILCGFTNFSKDTNIIEYQSPDEESDYQRLSLAVLSLCIDNFNFYPNSKAIEDIYHYFDKNLINRKKVIIPYYYKKNIGKYSQEFNDTSLKIKYTRLLRSLIREGTPVPVPVAK